MTRFSLSALFCGGAVALVQNAMPTRRTLTPTTTTSRDALMGSGFEGMPQVKTVSDTMRAFEAAYPRTIVSLWRSPINDMLQVTHLSLVDNRFVSPDVMFGFGYITIFNLLLDKYPVPGEKEKLIDATLKALDLDRAQIFADFETVTAWIAGKTESDCLALATDESAGSLNEAYKTSVADPAAYYHTRAANVGMLTMMTTVGCNPDSDTLTRWTAALGLRKKNVEKDSLLLKEVKEKMSQAMQMVKAMEIREKKRLADSLEQKAKEAQEKASAAGAASAAITAE